MEAACATVTSVRGTVPAGMVYRARAVGELAGKVTLRLRGCYCVLLGRNVECCYLETVKAPMPGRWHVCGATRCKSDLQCPDMLVFIQNRT